MISSKKHILFVSHDASRTGAPIVLLHFLKWLKRDGRYNFSIYLQRSGELREKFVSISNTYGPIKNGLIKRMFTRIFQTRQEYDFPKKLKKQKFDLIYLNTVEGMGLIQILKKKFNCPVICHIHENQFTLQRFYTACFSERNIKSVNHFIAVSNSTRNNLIENYLINPDKISLIYEFIRLDETRKKTLGYEEIKTELGLRDEFIVGGSGLATWRKGVDLFIQLAVILNKMEPGNNVKLIWVGLQNYEAECQFLYEVKRLGIEEKIIFIGEKKVPQNYFQLFHVFALTSREDPFPLVALEAASLQIPIICFRDAGGIEELLLDNKGGIIVDYGNVEEMAKAILYVKHQKNIRLKLGREAADLITKYDVDVVSKQLAGKIAEFI